MGIINFPLAKNSFVKKMITNSPFSFKPDLLAASYKSHFTRLYAFYKILLRS